jgi:hypothetical protein
VANGGSATTNQWFTYRSSASIYLRLPAGEAAHEVAIFNTSGQQVARFSTTNEEVEILAAAPKGIYLVNLNGVTQRVVK